MEAPRRSSGRRATPVPNPYAAPQSQPGETQWRPKASHVFVVAAIVFGVGTFLQQAYKLREAQYQRVQAEQALMDADRARETAEVNREVMERVLREKRMEQQGQ